MRKSVRLLTHAPLITLAIFLLIHGHAQAGSFEDGVAETYGAFRTAESYLRTGNAGLASLDLAHASDTWNAISMAAKSKPPAAFANDPKFNQTLTEVSQTLSEALALAEADDAKQAYKTIIPVRRLIYELRQRNGQRGYADCITELNAAMDKMYVYRHNPPDFAKPEVRTHASEIQSEYAKILDECIGMAPGAYTGNPEFKRLTQSTQASVKMLMESIEAKETASYISVLRELRSFDRIIFFRFGS